MVLASSAGYKLKQTVKLSGQCEVIAYRTRVAELLQSGKGIMSDDNDARIPM